jgi:hypothetical protein
MGVCFLFTLDVCCQVHAHNSLMRP